MIAPLKYPGAKWSYSKWITSFIPEHKLYLDPFFGSGAVFFTKPPARFETINDIDGLVINFFKACRDYPEQLARAINLTPYARDEFRAVEEDHAGESIKLTGNCVEDARRFCIRCSQGFGSKLADRVGWKNTKRPSGPVNPAVWSKIPDTIFQIANRLKNAQIENRDAVELIRAYNGPDCFIYADPPYLSGTRDRRIYHKEMAGPERHEKLLNALLEHQGPVIISGYDNDLYDKMLSGWHKEQKRGHADNATARTETIWLNYHNQLSFFDM